MRGAGHQGQPKCCDLDNEKLELTVFFSLPFKIVSFVFLKICIYSLFIVWAVSKL